ncbi:MAG: radical SAM protein, partial [Deltaproteobacteria bacterium]|nr:radical SAM protein [Deltaproteobacteria bacterium]
DQPLDSDAQLRGKMANVEKRAQRQSPRFPGLDLDHIQKAVDRNLLKLPLFFEGRYMGLPDLLNYLKNHRRFPSVTPDNASNHYLFANGFTLNGIYFYQFLRHHGYDPVIVQNYSLENLHDILNEKPLAVCISSTFLYLDDIRDMAEEIKAVDHTIPVIVGGILVKKIMHAGNNLAPQTLNWLNSFSGLVDAFVIETHGEDTLISLLEAWQNGGDLTEVPNLGIFDDEGRIIFTLRQEETVNLDRMAIAWDDIPRRYLRNTLSVISSQGCHYRCRFCTYHRWFPKVHYKSLEVLKDELRRIHALGFVTHVRFADDNFTANRKRLEAVLEMMIHEKFDFTWSAFARANTITPELVRLMKASGCEFLNMGIESGSRDVLNMMDKKLDPVQAVEAVRMLRENGIHTLGGFIIGYPGETRETFNETVDLINRSGLHYYHPYLFYYSKSMLVHREADQFGIEGVGWTWRHRTMDAVEASELMTGMIRQCEHAFTDGQQKTWETFKLLKGEGYPAGEILELHRLKRALQLALENSSAGSHPSPEVDSILDRMEGIIHRRDAEHAKR